MINLRVHRYLLRSTLSKPSFPELCCERLSHKGFISMISMANNPVGVPWVTNQVIGLSEASLMWVTQWSSNCVFIHNYRVRRSSLSSLELIPVISTRHFYGRLTFILIGCCFIGRFRILNHLLIAYHYDSLILRYHSLFAHSRHPCRVKLTLIRG